jgi:hypothetical protein
LTTECLSCPPPGLSEIARESHCLICWLARAWRSGAKIVPTRYDAFRLQVSAPYREAFERELKNRLERANWRIVPLKRLWRIACIVPICFCETNACWSGAAFCPRSHRLLLADRLGANMAGSRLGRRSCLPRTLAGKCSAGSAAWAHILTWCRAELIIARVPGWRAEDQACKPQTPKRISAISAEALFVIKTRFTTEDGYALRRSPHPPRAAPGLGSLPALYPLGHPYSA